MPQSQSLTDEISRRLEHLRTMPETPARHREILALERALVQAPTVSHAPERPRSAPRTLTDGDGPVRARRVRASATDPDELTPAPRKVVTKKGDHRRVVIRAASQDKEDDGALSQEARKDQINDIRNLLGLQHRGMS